MQLLTSEEAEVLALLDGAFSLEGAQVVVWQLQQCLKSGRKLRPTVSKASAALALRKLARERLAKQKEMERIRERLNELYS